MSHTDISSIPASFPNAKEKLLSMKYSTSASKYLLALRGFCEVLASESMAADIGSARLILDYTGRSVLEQYTSAAKQSECIYDTCAIFLALALEYGQTRGLNTQNLSALGVPVPLVATAQVLTAVPGETHSAALQRAQSDINALHSLLCLYSEKVRLDNIPAYSDRIRVEALSYLERIYEILTNPHFQASRSNRHRRIVSRLHDILSSTGKGSCRVVGTQSQDRVVLELWLRDELDEVEEKVAKLGMNVYPDTHTVRTFIETTSDEYSILFTSSQEEYKTITPTDQASRLINAYCARLTVYQ